MANETTRTAEKDARFLDALSRGLSVSAACRASGYTRSRVYVRRADDESFAALWQDAHDAGTEALEDEARRRAVEGVAREHTHYHLGQHIGTDVETKYSDTLLIFLLKARNPDKYREHAKLDITGELGIKVYTDPIVNEV